MRDDHVEAEHEEQEGEGALQEAVEGSGHAAQAEEPHNLYDTEDTLFSARKVNVKEPG